MRPRLAALVLVVLLAPAAQAAQMALVIGVGAYEHFRPLRNTVPDAEAVASKLAELGVEVTLSLDAGHDALEAALDDFAFRAETADLALIYFAGHGVEVQGENLLVPADADAGSNRALQEQAVSLDRFLGAVDGGRVMRVVILDACRDNPFGDALAPVAATGGNGPSGGTRSAAVSALAPADPDRGTLVAYAASRGQVSFDGAGGNSPFARALVDAMGQPGLEIGLLFRRVRDEVLDETQNLQEPYTYGSLPATPFYLGRAGGAPAPDADGRPEAWAGLDPTQERSLEDLAEAGDTRALLAMGYRLMAPDDPARDPARAVAFFRRAADLGSPEAQFEMGKAYEFGRGVEPDPAEALRFYEAAAAQDDARAVNELGVLHFTGGLGLPADPVRAAALIGRAADLGFPLALFNYAALIDDGVVAGRAPDEAGPYLYRALRTGSPDVFAQLLEAPTQFKPETRVALQRVLRANGFYDGALDGDIGPGTQAAIRAAYGAGA